MPKVVILGAGFAGLSVVKTLRREGYQGDITLVSPAPRFFYSPSLIWVPSGQRDESDLTLSLDAYFARQKVTHFAASVTALDLAQRTVETDHGALAYDFLVIASGGRFLKKLPGIEHATIPCEGYAPVAAYAEKLRALSGGHLAFGFAGNPDEPSAMRGGPVFEFLFGVDTLLRREGRRARFKLAFFSPAAEPGKRMGPNAVPRLQAEMQKRGIATHLGHKLKAIGASRVETEGGDIAADLTLFMPGLTGPAWLEGSGLPRSPGGFVQADQHCRVPGVAGVYVAGDAGSYPGPDWLPKQAHMADAQAVAAARNLLADMAGKPGEHGFTPELACIVDTLDNGILVYRSPKRAFLFKSVAMHWSKRFFERHYLAQYR